MPAELLITEVMEYVFGVTEANVEGSAMFTVSIVRVENERFQMYSLIVPPETNVHGKVFVVGHAVLALGEHPAAG